MKILLTSIILFFTSGLYPAAADTARTICVLTPDDDVAAFRTIGKIFNSSGFDLEDSEEALMVVTTEIMNRDYGVFNLKRIAIKLKAEISMSDSITTIKLTGQYMPGGEHNSGFSEPYFEKYSNAIIQTDTSDMAEKTAWDYMMQIAQKYKNGKIRTER